MNKTVWPEIKEAVTYSNRIAYWLYLGSTPLEGPFAVKADAEWALHCATVKIAEAK